MDEIGGGLDEAGGVVGFGFLEGEGGGDAGVGKRSFFAAPLFGKEESLMLLELGVSSRTERGAIRPYSGLNTPLFCHSRMAKILVDRQKSKSF